MEAGAARHLFEQGLREAGKKERDLLEPLRSQPGGAERSAETKQMIDRLGTFIGYREYPKYAIVSRHAVYKQALSEEADRLVRVVLDITIVPSASSRISLRSSPGKP